MKLDELVNQYYDDLNMNDLHIGAILPIIKENVQQ